MAAHMQIRGKWKDIKIDPNAFIQHDLSGFVCMQELTDYDIITDSDKGASSVKKSKKKQNTSKDKTNEVNQPSESTTRPNKKKKKNKKKTLSLPNDASDAEVDVNKQKKLNKESVSGSKEDSQKGLLKKEKRRKDTKNSQPKLNTGNSSELKSKNVAASDTSGQAKCNKVSKKLHHELKSPDDGSKRTKKSSKPTKRKLDDHADGSDGESKPCKKLKKDKSHKKDAKDVKWKSHPNLPDMSAWKDLFVPEPVLKALAEKNFTAPTPIQTLVLAPAIRDKKDIVGAAETGSGKTLAFGIPLIHSILKLKQIEQSPTQQDRSLQAGRSEERLEEASSDQDLDEHDLEKPDSEVLDPEEYSDSEEEELSFEDSSSDIADPESDTSIDDKDSDQEEPQNAPLQMDFKSKANKKKRVRPLYALVLAPTRELAIQVRDHLQVAARYSGMKVVAIVGGMAVEKQTRLLKKQPEIVVATPGRLWELLEEGNSHLSKVSDIRCLVIDEADRMVEKGHFEELSKLLSVINKDEAKVKKRQTFVFSATLTFVHSTPQRMKYKKKAVQMTEKQKLEDLMMHVGIKPKPKIVDLTRSERTAETLTEARINCTIDEKDLFLYYFLKQYPGRTLVFANSKDCIRRLVSIFNLLQCCPLPLHADMHQRQRLKNLDRFKGNPKALLLATDVAARGLDIPDVKHVIHYQVPRTTENYVHRSGRTARASKEGLSVMFVGPEDLQYYRKIIKSLNRDEDLPLFPIEQSLLPGVKARVNTARHIDKLQHGINKQKMQNSWYEKAAKDMDIELDDVELLNDLGNDREQSQMRKSLDQFNLDLKCMLREPLSAQSYLGKYPTKSGKLPSAYHKREGQDNAVQKLKQAQKIESKLSKKHKKKSNSKRYFKRKSKSEDK